MDRNAAKSGLMAPAARSRPALLRSENAMDDPGAVRFETSEVLRLFPVFVWKAQLASEACRPINAAIRALLAELAPGAPAAGTLWQSGHGLHRRAACAGLVQVIERAVREVVEFLKIGHREFAITGCWANVAAPGGWHRVHSHPNNFLSGVYYVQVQEGAETIAFHDPRPQAGVIRPPVTELTAYNTDQVIVTVAVGTLLVFPAWLPHSVDSNASAAERISVSFNVMFSDLAGQLAQPLWGEE
jgi:uncharacterized protein (TIGR02466 family)